MKNSENQPLLGKAKVKESQVWILAIFVGAFVFSDHYFRDFIGALDVEIQEHLGLSSTDFGIINTLFFAPNIIMPLFLGVFTNWLTPNGAAILFAFIASLGYSLFSVGIYFQSYYMVLISRVICGIVYESLDMVYFVYFLVFMPEWIARITTIAQSFVRSGSVLTFFISPLLYNSFGMNTASIFASAVGVMCLPISIAFLWFHKAFIERIVSDGGSGQAHEALPTMPALRLFPKEFWIMGLGALMMYANLIPFIMLGSEFIQMKYGYSNQSAGYLMLLLEGLSIPLGILYTHWMGRATNVTLASILTICSLFVPVSYLLLGFTNVPALLLILIMGFACSTMLLIYFAVLAIFIPHEVSALGTGIASAMFNIGPAVVPYILGVIGDSMDSDKKYSMQLFVLAVISFCATLCFNHVRHLMSKVPKSS